MRKLLFFVTLILGLAGGGQALAVEFTAKFIQERSNQKITGAILVADQKIRMDIIAGNSMVTTISRLDKNLVWVMNIGERSYYEVKKLAMGPEAGVKYHKELEKIADRKVLGKERLEGYDCEMVQFVFHDKKYGAITQWIAQKLNYPIKTVHESSEEKIITTFFKITETSVDPVMFEIPEKFKKLEPAQKVKPEELDKD